MASRCCVCALAMVLWLPVGAHAQTASATFAGVVTDESAGVLPGVTVTLSELNTGRQQVTVTDLQGEFRIENLAPGTYRLVAALEGFSSVEMPSMELLVGQNVRRNFTMSIGLIQEMITVTSEAPLIDITSSQVSGNVDRRQMEDLPLQGRNWMELSMLVKGITANSVGNQPGVDRDDAFQLNLDGQQITQKVAGSGFGQPKFSREAIAEFQIVTNMFDITQGRSTGVQVQAVSKAGSNSLHGVYYGYFRNDRFNEADLVAKKVLPYSNQQAGGTLGGPIIRDKAHYFVSFEYEREPSTSFNQPTYLPGQTFEFATKRTEKSFLGRYDQQLNNNNSLTIRGTRWAWGNPFELASGENHPSRAAVRTRDATNIIGSWAQVINDTTVGELRVGYGGFSWLNSPQPELIGTPEYVFPGLTVGAAYNYPQEFWQNTIQARYDLSLHRDRHDFKIGAEYLRIHDTGDWNLVRAGRYLFTSRPANLTARFPTNSWNNPSAWNVSGLEPNLQRFDQNYHRMDWRIDIPRPTFAIWFGDNWRVSDNLSINYGVRWDDDWGATAPPGITDTDILIDNGFESLNAGYRSNIRDHNNIAPRVGFTYNVGGGDDLVIRGGSGLYYATPISNVTFSHQIYNQMIAGSFNYDGRPGFMEDPTRGVTSEQILSGQVPVPPQAARVLSTDYKMPYTWQSSLGFQKQLGPVMAVEADLTHWQWNNDTRDHDVNLFYDPSTGYNVNPNRGRPNPNYTQVNWFESTGTRDNMALSTGLTRRFKDNFQGGATYTLMLYAHDNGTIGWTAGASNNPFDILDGEWARSTSFQRHTLRLNAMYQLPYEITISGLYFFGSGNYYQTTHASAPYGKPGTNRLNLGAPVQIPADVQDRFDGPSVIGTGDVVPRNALKGFPLHKVDVRVTKAFTIANLKVSAIAEVFNLLNHANYGNYVTTVNSSTFGQPRASAENAYIPRSGQFAFRISF